MKDERSNSKAIPSMLEIVFEFRNKEYGAYYLRTVYKKHTTLALVIAIVVVSTVAVVPFINAYLNQQSGPTTFSTGPIETIDAPKDEVAPPPPPPPPPPPAAVEQQATFTKLVVKDSVVEVEFKTADENKEETKNGDTAVAVTAAPEPEYEAPAEVFVSVEEPPTFPGGEDALRAYIAQNVDYPEQARENEIQGRVYVRFCVTFRGGVDQVSVLRGVHPLLDNAAIAVVKKMPAWAPGKQGGKAVNVWYTVPINFLLQQ